MHPLLWRRYETKQGTVCRGCIDATIAAQVLSAEPAPLEIPETMEASEQIPISGVVIHEQWDFYSLGCLLSW